MGAHPGAQDRKNGGSALSSGFRCQSAPPLARRRERPRLHRLRQRQRADEIGDVVAERVQSQPHRVGHKAHAGEPPSFQRMLAAPSLPGPHLALAAR